MNGIGGRTNFWGSPPQSIHRNTSTTAAGQGLTPETAAPELQPREEFIAGFVSNAIATDVVQGVAYIGNGISPDCNKHVALRIEQAQQAHMHFQSIKYRKRYVELYVEEGQSLWIPADQSAPLSQALTQAGEQSWQSAVMTEWEASEEKKNTVASAMDEWQTAVREHAAQLANQLYGATLSTLSSVLPQPGAGSRAAELHAFLNRKNHSRIAEESDSMASSGKSLSDVSFDDAHDMAALTLSSPHSIEKGTQRVLQEEKMPSPGVSGHGSDDEDREWEIDTEDYAHLDRWNSSSTTASSSSRLAHPPATGKVAQASSSQELGFHSERKNSVEELAREVEEFSKRQRINKNHDRVKKKFRKGVHKLNESDKPAISLEGAEAYYIKNYATKRTRLPADLTAIQKARKEDLAKQRMGSDATIAKFERDYKRKRRERAKNAMDSSQQSPDRQE